MSDLRFEHPEFLLIALLIVPLALVGWWGLKSMDRVRRVTSIALRGLLVLAIAIALAGPHTVRSHDDVTVIGVVDVSGSVRRFAHLPEIGALSQESAQTTMQAVRAWFRKATETRRPMDRFGLVVFDGEATVISAPTRGDYIDDNLDLVRMDGTNIAEGIRLALALLPPDTARRLVLMTDGNETAGSALEAARRAAGLSIASAAAHAGVPIDIVPITYNVAGDVQVQRVESPPFARPGERVTVRIVMEATRATPGRLSLMREGLPVPIGTGGATTREITVPPGQSVELALVELGETPVNRFEAIFEPSDPRDDTLPENNLAESFTITPAQGAVLIVEHEGAEQSSLASALSAVPMRVESRTAPDLPHDLLAMQNFELVILNNVPAYELTRGQQQMLANFVNDLGGGLLMVGGEDSFGAGGWAGTPIEAVLPLDMSPPKELILPTAALVLVLDKSGSMEFKVGGARGTQQEVANEGAAQAIESLRSNSMVGVVTFDTSPHEFIPLQQNNDPERLADLVRGIAPEGGTDIEPALRLAYTMLRTADVDRKHVVCLSDGRAPTGGLEELAHEMANHGIRLSTIAVGDDADRDTLQKLAEIGGGEFYLVHNPRSLPRILVDAVQVVNKPLIKESIFEPVVHSSGEALGLSAATAPPLAGLVITALKPSPLVAVELTHPDGDPLLAHWQSGLGRTAAFTSDAEGHWSSQWQAWSGYQAFWAQVVRSIARPPGEPDAELFVSSNDNAIRMTLDMSMSPEKSRAYMQVDATVYTPTGESQTARLRQVGPGLYEGAVPASQAGNYIVVVSPRRGERRLAPLIGGVTRPTSAEFRRYRSNIALLNDLVEATKGRQLAIEAPEEASIFDRTRLPRTVSSLPAWPFVIWIALGIMLLDIACRRIAWRTSHLTALATAAVRKAPTRTDEAQATLTTLRTSENVKRPERTLEERTDGPAPIREVPMRAPRPAVDEEPALEERPAKRAPTAEDIQRAIDALRGSSSERDTSPKKKPESTPQDTTPQRTSDTTERLLRAKRRAREEDRDQ